MCSNAGTLLLADTATALSVTDTLDTALAGLTPSAVTHTAGVVLSTLAIALNAGASCLDDLTLTNPLVATGLVSPVASVPTAHRRIHQLAERINTVDERLTPAMRTLRTRAWSALGELNPTTLASKDNPLIIDVDASLIHIHSKKAVRHRDVQERPWLPPAVRVRRPRPWTWWGAVGAADAPR